MCCRAAQGRRWHRADTVLFAQRETAAFKLAVVLRAPDQDGEAPTAALLRGAKLSAAKLFGRGFSAGKVRDLHRRRPERRSHSLALVPVAFRPRDARVLPSRGACAVARGARQGSEEAR